MKLSSKHTGIQRCTAPATLAAGRPMLPLRAKRLLCKPVAFRDDDTPDVISGRRIDQPGITVPAYIPVTPHTSAPGTRPSHVHLDPLTFYPVTAAEDHPVNVGPMARSIYRVLGTLSAASAVAAICLPDVVGKVLFNRTPSPTNTILMQAAGATLLPTIFNKRALLLGSQVGDLNLPTFKHLNTASLIHGIIAMVILTQAVSLRSPVLAAVVGGMASLAILNCSYCLTKSRTGGGIFPSIGGIVSDVLRTFAPSNLRSAVYSILTLAYAGMGTMLLMANPDTPYSLFTTLALAAGGSYHNAAVATFLTRITGAGLLAAAVTTASLRAASDANRICAPVYKDMNLGMSGLGMLMASVWAVAMTQGVSLRNNLAWGWTALNLLTLAFCGVQYVRAP